MTRWFPLDETLVQAAVDLSGRPYVVHHEPDGMAPLIGSYDTTLTRHFFESLAFAAGICLHVRVIDGRNAHHIVEAQFKAFARALRQAAVAGPAGRRHPEHEGRAVLSPPASQRAAVPSGLRSDEGATREDGTSKAARRRAGEKVVLDYGSGNLPARHSGRSSGSVRGSR